MQECGVACMFCGRKLHQNYSILSRLIQFQNCSTLNTRFDFLHIICWFQLDYSYCVTQLNSYFSFLIEVFMSVKCNLFSEND